MKSFVKENLFEIILTVAGALAGFLYWKFIGCLTGTCLIKSVWYYSTLYGMLLGYLAGDIIRSIYEKIKSKNKSNE